MDINTENTANLNCVFVNTYIRMWDLGGLSDTERISLDLLEYSFL